MLRIPTIYLETTIFNFPFADDAPQYRDEARQLFSEIKAGKFKPFSSEYVIRELENTKDTKKLGKMRTLILDYGITVIPASKEIEHLASVYIKAGVIPEKYETDAFHIAAATVNGVDYIISLNFRHIVT